MSMRRGSAFRRATNALGVGACNDRGSRSAYSNFGKGIALVAPSDDRRRQGITTTDVHPRRRDTARRAYCDDFGGTSSATPLVAGVAALVLWRTRHSRHEVRDVLKSTADKIDRANGRYRDGFSLQYGFGRVNGEAAVELAKRRKTRGKRRKVR